MLEIKKKNPRQKNRYRIIVIGASMGGMKGLQTILSLLPKPFKIPIAIVKHREESSDDMLAHNLMKYTELPVRDVEDKDIIKGGVVYLAPGGYHLMVEEDHFALSTEESVSFSRPSIDVLFQSAADAFGNTCIGIILSGMNRDGAAGMKYIKEAGGLTIVQDPDESEQNEMPNAAIAAVKVDHILTSAKIGELIATKNVHQ